MIYTLYFFYPFFNVLFVFFSKKSPIVSNYLDYFTFRYGWARLSEFERLFNREMWWVISNCFLFKKKLTIKRESNTLNIFAGGSVVKFAQRRMWERERNSSRSLSKLRGEKIRICEIASFVFQEDY